MGEVNAGVGYPPTLIPLPPFAALCSAGRASTRSCPASSCGPCAGRSDRDARPRLRGCPRASGKRPHGGSVPVTLHGGSCCHLGFRYSLRVTKHNNCRWERCPALGISKLHAATKESHLATAGPLMPPAGISPGRHKAHHKLGGRLRGLPSLAHPVTDSSPVGWIHEDAPLPGLREPIIGGSEVAFALGALCRAARVEVKPKLSIQVREQGGRRRPLGACGTEMDRAPASLSMGCHATPRGAESPRAARLGCVNRCLPTVGAFFRHKSLPVNPLRRKAVETKCNSAAVHRGIPARPPCQKNLNRFRFLV